MKIFLSGPSWIKTHIFFFFIKPPDNQNSTYLLIDHDVNLALLSAAAYKSEVFFKNTQLLLNIFLLNIFKPKLSNTAQKDLASYSGVNEPKIAPATVILVNLARCVISAIGSYGLTPCSNSIELRRIENPSSDFEK